MAAPVVRFGEFRLDPGRRALWRGDRLVELPPLAFDCLAYLIEHRERAVGRAELTSAVWGRVDVSDNLLNQIMLRCRRAIDDVDENRYAIRTVPRFGYAWIAPVVPDSAAEGSPEAAGSSAHMPVARDAVVSADGVEDPLGIADAGDVDDAVVVRTAASDSPATGYPGLRVRRRLRRWLAIAMVVAISLAAVFAIRQGFVPPPVPATATTVAAGTAVILPVDIPAGAAHAWMRLGLMDAMAGRLREAGQPVVPSDNVVALVRGPDGSGDDRTPDRIAALADATSAALVFDARAEPHAGGWRVHLGELRNGDPALVVDAEATDPLAAAYLAADALARALGRVPAGEVRQPDTHELAQLLQEVKAAVWSERHDQARVLLQAASARYGAELDVRYWLAEIDQLAGRDLQARSAFERLLDDPQLDDDPQLHARTLHGLAYTWFRQSDYAVAERYFDEVVVRLEGSDSLDARNQLGLALSGRGATRTSARRYEEARQDFTRARIALEGSGDQLGVARLDNAIGVLQERLGRLADAIPYFQRAADRAALFNAIQPELRARTNIARDQLMLLDPAAAFAQDMRLTQLLDRTTDRGLRQFVNLVRVMVFDANGRLRDAERLLQRIRADPAEGLDRAQSDWMGVIAADHALASGRVTEAVALADAALSPALEAASPSDFAYGRYLSVLGKIQQGRVQDAADAATAARDWRGVADAADPTAVLSLLTWARYADESGMDKEAGEAYAKAMPMAESLRMPAIALLVTQAYAEFEMRRNDLERATTIAGRSADWAEQSWAAALLQLRLHHARRDVAAWQVARARALALAGEREVPAELLARPLELAPAP